MRFTTDALVIKETNMGERDRLITLMTRDVGVIRAYAAGAKSIKSKKGAATGLLSYSSFTIEKKGENYRVQEASVIRTFFGAGSDVLNLTLAQYFCELCLVLGPQDSGSEEFLRLILNSLHFLTEKKRNPILIKAITELRIAAISGYCPNLIACDGCGKFEDDVMYFKLENGSLICSECFGGENYIPINLTLLNAMRHIVFSKLEKLYSFEIPDDAANSLSRITENYIKIQTDHNFTTLQFYNSIL